MHESEVDGSIEGVVAVNLSIKSSRVFRGEGRREDRCRCRERCMPWFSRKGSGTIAGEFWAPPLSRDGDHSLLIIHLGQHSAHSSSIGTPILLLPRSTASLHSHLASARSSFPFPLPLLRLRSFRTMADSETYHPGKGASDTINVGNPEATFYVPLTTPSTGTALSGDDWPQNKALPKLFEPIQVGPLEFKNRIFVAPMCQYSCEAEGDHAGVLTAWHTVHLGQLAQRGAACVMVEASACSSSHSFVLFCALEPDLGTRVRDTASVLPNGRISPQDSGLWNDTQRDALKSVFDLIRSLGARPAIQLAHAGRKASTLSPWLDTSTIKAPLKSHVAENGEASGWTDNVWAPSAVSYDEETFPMPKEMSLDDIEELKEAWKAATIRADQAGSCSCHLRSCAKASADEWLGSCRR